ncbi:hypothetical protein Salat_0028200 [Sesamum alatum]|uniref:Uncharacterized protein n=1 Tax=Sesamum alatum TaxID=300844 RepID=A0AAE1YVS5_9LAMI|nr:hypothetical protein Salat_0028200 [Sesamum alatum]
MEGEKRKRKREEKAEATVPDDRTKQAEAVVVEAPPTEEEVEEFFAILRRMRVAVKYFKKDASNSKDGGYRAQNQTAEAAADGGKRPVAENSGLDLNAVPEAETSLV